MNTPAIEYVKNRKCDIEEIGGKFDCMDYKTVALLEMSNILADKIDVAIAELESFLKSGYTIRSIVSNLKAGLE